ncbi:MAG: flagellin [Candidatus Latescibacteria bacterium]|nr:flagellin [Candidatus Latescibacterota bacterium]
MPARINHNPHLKQVHRNLTRHYAEAVKQIEHLSSGNRVDRASDDPASLYMADTFVAEVRAVAEGNRNAQQGIGLLQVADGALGQLGEIVQRLQSLAVQAATGLYTDDQRGSIDVEFEGLKSEMDRIAKATTYNDTPLFDIPRGFTIEIGPSIASGNDFVDFTLNDMSAQGSHLNIGSLTIDTVKNAREALAQLQRVEEQVAEERNKVAALHNRLDLNSTTSTSIIEKLHEAESNVRDIDVARAMTELTRSQILSQAAASLAVESDTDIDQVLSLLG